MKTNKKALSVGLLAALMGLGAQNVKAEDANLGTMPYLHPHRCNNLIDTDGYDVYWSHNCEIAYIAPNAEAQAEHHVNLSGGISQCDSYQNLNTSLTTITDSIAKNTELANIELTKGNIKGSQKYAEDLKELTEQYQMINSIYANTAIIEGANVKSYFRNDISSDDITKIITKNQKVLFNMEKSERPDFQVLPLTNSIYSFSLYRGDGVAKQFPSILTTNIPALEVLTQVGSSLPTAHVKLDGSAVAETKLSLNGACPMVEKVDSAWKVKANANQTFITVNRSYDVEMKAGYSLTATLDTHITNTVVETLIKEAKNHNLTKTQIYNRTLDLDGMQATIVELDTDIPLTNDEKTLITADVQQRLLDRYLAIYEKKGTLTSMRPVEVVAPDGGNIDVTYWATRCWSHHGFFHSSSGCYDYSYQVPEWNDGYGYNSNGDTDEIDATIYEKNSIYDVVTISRSTMFTDAKVLSENEVYDGKK
jgi:hypothetical protein